MKRRDREMESRDWAAGWLDRVACGGSTMSQRKLSSLKSRGIGLAALRRLARDRRVHLLLLQDDHGTPTVVASLRPFKVIC